MDIEKFDARCPLDVAQDLLSSSRLNTLDTLRGFKGKFIDHLPSGPAAFDSEAEGCVSVYTKNDTFF